MSTYSIGLPRYHWIRANISGHEARIRSSFADVSGRCHKHTCCSDLLFSIALPTSGGPCLLLLSSVQVVQRGRFGRGAEAIRFDIRTVTKARGFASVSKYETWAIVPILDRSSTNVNTRTLSLECFFSIRVAWRAHTQYGERPITPPGMPLREKLHMPCFG